MNGRWGLLAVAGLVIAGFSACGGGRSSPTTPPPNNTTPPFQTSFTDPSGTVNTVSQPEIKTTNPFFAVLGTNARTCASCHDAADGWSVTPAHLQQRFNSHPGHGPDILAVDGANCPSDDVSTLAATTSAYSQLLNHGLIRMTLPVPANAEFSIVAITDPYQCPETTATQPALYRRPLPSTNLKFLNGIMWDGREPDLQTQALDATLVHTQPSTPPTDAQLQQIVNLESSLFTAQIGGQPGRRPDLHRAQMAARRSSRRSPSLPGLIPEPGLIPTPLLCTPTGPMRPAANAAAQQSMARGERCCSTLSL